MRLNNLQLINFRNYDNLHLNFKRNINLLVGKNGQGKTNIVEAIYMLSFGKSLDRKSTRLNSSHSQQSRMEVKIYISVEII